MDKAKLCGLGMWGVVGAIGAAMFNISSVSARQNLQPTSEVKSVDVNPMEFVSVFQAGGIVSVQSANAGSDVTLLGIIYSSDDAESKALLTMLGGKPKVYTLNSTLPNGARVSKIDARSIDLSVDGGLVTLALPITK